MLGYDKPPYLMAFDHRGSFEHDLFGATEPASDEVRDGIISVSIGASVDGSAACDVSFR